MRSFVTLLVSIALFGYSVAPVIAEEFGYPEEDSHTFITFPDSWDMEYSGDALHGGPKDGSVYFGVFNTSETNSEDVGKLIGTLIDSLVPDYEKDESMEEKREVNGTTLYISGGRGTLKKGNVPVKFTIIFFAAGGDPDNFIGAYYFGAPKFLSKHAKALDSVLESIEAAE